LILSGCQPKLALWDNHNPLLDELQRIVSLVFLLDANSK